MKFLYTKRFKELLAKLPKSIQKKFNKQIYLLESNIRHPSLQIKKMQGHANIWEARIDYNYRFTFSWKQDVIILRIVGSHDDALKNP